MYNDIYLIFCIKKIITVQLFYLLFVIVFLYKKYSYGANTKSIETKLCSHQHEIRKLIQEKRSEIFLSGSPREKERKRERNTLIVSQREDAGGKRCTRKVSALPWKTFPIELNTSICFSWRCSRELSAGKSLVTSDRKHRNPLL